MSGIAKAVKKVWRPIEKLNSKLVNIGTLGLHNKTKKFRHKIIKSKVFKIVVAAAAIYFGGAALLSLANGGTAMAGIGSAWSGVTGAGSALASGNFAAAGSSLSAGFTSGSAAGAAGTFAGGKAAATMAAAGGNAAAVGSAAAGAQASGYTGSAMKSWVAAGGNSASMTPALTGAASGGAATAADINAALTGPAATPPQSGGLLSGIWNGLGDAGKAAAITSGVNIGGQMLQGHAAEKEAEEERKRRTYWGVNGEGQGDTSGNSMKGLLQLAQTTPMNSFKPSNAPWNAPQPQQFTPQVQQPPQTLDELIKRLG